MTDPPDRLRHALADRYTIEREIGRGGMATVYLAEDLKHHRKVAIKVLRPELAATLGAERFLREIQIAANLNHPHILPLLDSGTAEERPTALPPDRPSAFLYYVMPYIEGESLRDRLTRERQLPIEDSVRITSEVAAALSHAHSLGVIHRDIKPENILLSAGEAVVADFGIARAVSAAGGEQLTETGMAVGTPAYMSPEQATAEEVDGRSDIYSLGCVLYEMLGGDPPYLGSTPKAVLARKLTEPVPGLHALRDTVPQSLEQAVQKALAKTPADRFQTAGAFTEALTAPAISAPPQEAATPHVTKVPMVVLAVIVVIAIVIGGWWATNRVMPRGNRIERLIVLPPMNLMDDSTQDYFIDGIHDELIARLNQLPGLEVISRTTAAKYKDTDKTVPEIAGEVNVDAALESSVLRFGDSVRIQVQLIEAFPRERHRWQNTYDRPYRDILTLHSQVALDVAEQIHITLRPEQQEQLEGTRPVNPVAYDAVLRARHLLDTWGVREVRQAIDFLEQAIAADSSYADAYAWLSRAYDIGGSWFGDMAASEAYSRALNAVETALELDSTLALAHTALGSIRFRFLWDWERADAAFQKALDLDPGSAEAHQRYSNFLRFMGRHDEGLFQAERAMELSPLWVSPVGEAAMFYHDAGLLDSARATMARALELQPGWPIAYWVLAQWRVEENDFDGALEILEREGFANVPSFAGVRAVLYVRQGETARARTVIDSLQQRPYPEHWLIASAYAALGEDSTALTWFERGYRERDPHMVFIGTMKSSDPALRLRSHPRFQAVLEQMNFPASATRER